MADIAAMRLLPFLLSEFQLSTFPKALTLPRVGAFWSFTSTSTLHFNCHLRRLHAVKAWSTSIRHAA